jgi:hypothetical protein
MLVFELCSEQDEQCELLDLARQVWRHGCIFD